MILCDVCAREIDVATALEVGGSRIHHAVTVRCECGRQLSVIPSVDYSSQYQPEVRYCERCGCKRVFRFGGDDVVSCPVCQWRILL